MTRWYKSFSVASYIFLQIIKSFSATKCLGFFETLKGPNKTAILHRLTIENRHTRLRKFAFVLIDGEQFNDPVLLDLQGSLLALKCNCILSDVFTGTGNILVIRQASGRMHRNIGRTRAVITNRANLRRI